MIAIEPAPKSGGIERSHGKAVDWQIRSGCNTLRRRVNVSYDVNFALLINENKGNVPTRTIELLIMDRGKPQNTQAE